MRSELRKAFGRMEFNAGYQWSLREEVFSSAFNCICSATRNIAPCLLRQRYQSSKSLHSFGDALAVKTAAGVSTATTKSERVEVDWLLGTSKRQVGDKSLRAVVGQTFASLVMRHEQDN